MVKKPSAGGYLSHVSAFIAFFLISTPLFSDNSQKVLLLSFDGGMNSRIHDYLGGTFSAKKGFTFIQREGVLAKNGMTVTLPSLTAVSHLSIITGMSPAQHGVVSNFFHIVTDPIHQDIDGFSAPLDPNAETLWEYARKHHKTVGVVSYPGLDNTHARRSADWSINFSKSLSPSDLLRFKKSDFKSYTKAIPKEVRSFSEPQITDLSQGLSLIYEENNKLNMPLFHIIALDTTDDHTTNYDTFVFDLDDNLDNGFVGKTDHQVKWIGLGFTAENSLKGSWCKLILASPTLSEMEFYVGAVYQTIAFPASFQTQIDQKLGFWTGPPLRELERFHLTKEDFFIQARRLSEYLKEATVLGAQTQQWDLIISYQPLLDEIEHQFLNDESIVRRGYAQADSVVHDLVSHLPNTNHIYVSDHGMAPLTSVYYPNRELMKDGFISDIYKARAFSSGGFSHIYINLEGRQKNGIIPPSDFNQLRDRLIQLFQDKAPVAKIYTRENAAGVGLNHPNAGDVMMVAKPGYHFSNDMGNGDVLGPADFAGQHGYDPDLPSMKAIYAAWGPQIERKAVSDLSYKHVYPFILKLLGI